MRIAIDGRFYGPYGKGLGRYTQRLIEHLERIDHDNTYVILLRKENWDAYTPGAHNFSRVRADFCWYSVAEQFRMPLLLKSLNIDLVHFPHFNVPVFYRKPFVVTIHDLIITHHPTQKATTLGPFLYKLKRWGYTVTIRHAVRAAQSIITVSATTKKELLTHFHLDENKVAVTYEGCEPPLAKGDTDGTLQRNGIRPPYLLYVGNAFPHKNLETLIDAYALVQKSNPSHELVLVGKMDYFYNRLKNVVRSRGLQGVRFPGYVSDEDLAELYRAADIYVFPSFAEGFGLPPLEAMSYDIPVVASDASCMPEILGDAALYADPRRAETFTDAIRALLDSPERRAEFVRKGKDRFQRFQWSTMAEKTVALYSRNSSV